MLCFKLLNERVAQRSLQSLLHATRDVPEMQRMRELVNAQWRDRTTLSLPEVDLRTCPADVVADILPKSHKSVADLLGIYNDYVVRVSCSAPAPGRALFSLYTATPEWQETRRWLRPLASWPFAGGVLLLIARSIGGEIFYRGGGLSGHFGNGFLQVTDLGMFRAASGRFVEMPKTSRSLEDLVFPATGSRDKYIKALFSVSRSTVDQLRVALLNHCLQEGAVSSRWLARNLVGADGMLSTFHKKRIGKGIAIESAYAECLTILENPSSRGFADAYGIAVPRLLSRWDYSTVFGCGPSLFRRAPNRQFKPSTIEGIRQRLDQAYEEAKMRL